MPTSAEAPKTTAATVSLVLAILLRLSPVGADLLFACTRDNSLVPYMIVAEAFYIVIVAPLVVLFGRYSWDAFKQAPKRIVAVLLVLAAAVIMDISMVGYLLQRTG